MLQSTGLQRVGHNLATKGLNKVMCMSRVTQLVARGRAGGPGHLTLGCPGWCLYDLLQAFLQSWDTEKAISLIGGTEVNARGCS